MLLAVFRFVFIPVLSSKTLPEMFSIALFNEIELSGIASKITLFDGSQLTNQNCEGFL